RIQVHGAQRLEAGDAVHFGHVPVQQHHVRNRAAAEFHSLKAVLGLGGAQAEALEDVRRHAANDARIVDYQAKRTHEALLRWSLASPRPARRRARARFSVSRVWSDWARYSSNPAWRPAWMSHSSAWEERAI